MCCFVLYHRVAQWFQGGKRRSVEEELDVSSNQRIRCCELCACAVVLRFHALYVVSGGGHTHLSKTEVSYDFVTMKTSFIAE